jgi:hypothetical protein
MVSCQVLIDIVIQMRFIYINIYKKKSCVAILVDSFSLSTSFLVPLPQRSIV